MATWTRWVLARKRLVAGFWLVVALAGFAAVQPATDALIESRSPSSPSIGARRTPYAYVVSLRCKVNVRRKSVKCGS